MNEGKYEFLRVRREFRQPLVTGAGKFGHLDRIIIRTENSLGIGYGEIAPWPNFKTETIEEALEVLKSGNGLLKNLAEKITQLPERFPCLESALSSSRHWNSIEKFNRSLPCAGLLTQLNTKSLEEKISAGFKTIKLKILKETSLLEVAALIEKSPRNITFRLDANGSLDLLEAKIWVQWVRSQSNVEFIEQPLPVNHPGYSALGFSKVAMDESFTSPVNNTWEGPIVVKPLLVGDWNHFLQWKSSHRGALIYSSVFETAFGRQAALWLAHHETSGMAVGFDTLNSFIHDEWDQHTPGPSVRGLCPFDWHNLWRKLK